MYAGEHKHEHFLSINPRGQVPAVVLKDLTNTHGDIVLNESVAIIEFLEAVYPDAPVSLMPPKSNLRLFARCLRLINEFHQKLDPNNIFFPVVFQGATKEELKPKIDNIFKECEFWEKYCREGEMYLCGDIFTIADIICFPSIHVFISFGLPEKDFPEIHAWYRRVKCRESFRKLPFFDAFDDALKMAKRDDIGTILC